MTYNLPDVSYKTQIFYQSGQWVKPQGITMVYVTLIGAGAGGGGGTSAALGVAATGGGGGGSGAISRVLISADLVEDRLIVTVGRGGLGGASNGDGTTGSESRVDGTASFLSTLMTANGSGTAGLASGNGGSGGGATTIQSANLAGVAVFASSAGGTGGSSGIPNISYGFVPVTGPLGILPGCGGGSKDASNNSTNGGSIVGAGTVPNFSGGTTGGTINGISSQINTLSPLIFLGGTGGGGNGNGTGGNGGDGGIGSGGGGGGAGITGGTGGRGGNGLVIINCW